MRVVIASCSVDYSGRLDAHLPRATRLIMVKADGSVLVHSDGGSYKPLNWMSPPARLAEVDPDEEDRETGVVARWEVSAARTDDRLVIRLFEVLSDTAVELGADPGLTKDGVEAHLQELLAERVEVLGVGWRLVRREYPTPLGPVDLLVRDESGAAVAVEVKRVGGIDGVEQLTRYVDMLDRDPLLTPVRGLYAAQQIRPQARVLAEDRGIRCVVLDYDAMRGMDDPSSRLF